jgi:outer membrane protein TolC
MHRSHKYRGWLPAHFMILTVVLMCSLLVSTPALRAQVSEPNEAVSLSLAEAVDLALKNNLQSIVASEGIAQAKGEKGIGLSALLPNLSATAYQASLTGNLAAMGLPVNALPGFPAFVGPFNRFDARFQMVQSVFNLAFIRRYQAGSHGVELARERQRLATQMVTAATAISYLSVLQNEQAVSAAQSNVQLAETLLALAVNQKSTGVGAGIDVARAETRLASQRVHLAQAQTFLDNARLDFLRIVKGASGQPFPGQFILSDRMRFAVEPTGDTVEAIKQALADRVEISIAEQELQIAKTLRKAATAEWLPSISVFGDYGSSGLKPNEVSLPTRSVGVRLDVPIFNGGRTRFEMQIASSRQHESMARLQDVRTAVERDVRQALLNIKTREEQVRSAELAVSLATRELELAKDRFKNGVADNTEVVTAQTALENARLVFVSSLAEFNIARLNLASALGHVESFRL